MTCLSSLILNCLLNGTYVTAGLDVSLYQPRYERTWCYDRLCNGAKGILKLGTRLRLTETIEADLSFGHASYVNTNRDRGAEKVELYLTWYPFRN